MSVCAKKWHREVAPTAEVETQVSDLGSRISHEAHQQSSQSKQATPQTLVRHEHPQGSGARARTHHRANRRELLQPSSPKGRKAQEASVARLEDIAVGAGQPEAAGGKRIASVRNSTLTTAEPSQSNPSDSQRPSA